MTLPPPSPASPQPTLPPGTPVHTKWGWVTAWIPMASLLLTIGLLWMMSAAMLDWFQQLAFMVVAHQGDPRALDSSFIAGMFGTMMPFTLGSAALTLISWGLYALGVFAAYFDYAALGRLGYPRRFHWAWNFLNPVYPIGRAVVVHRQTGAGRATLWIAVSATAATFLISIVWTLWLVFAMLQVMTVFTGTIA